MTKLLTTTFVTGLALGASALLLPGTASAQPDSGFGDPVPAEPQPAPQPAPQPPPPPPAPVYQPAPTPPPPPPQPAATTQAPEPQGEPATARPVGMSMGLGISYLLGGAELDRPDGASARFRLDGGLTLEPFVRLATHGQSLEEADTKNAQNEIFLGSNVRLPLAGRGKVDLVAQVGAALSYFVDDPDGNDNNTSTLGFGIDYGLSVEYWVNQNWCLSFTARNPFISYVSRTIESPVDDEVATDTDIGVIWDPGIDAALHLFY